MSHGSLQAFIRKFARDRSLEAPSNFWNMSLLQITSLSGTGARSRVPLVLGTYTDIKRHDITALTRKGFVMMVIARNSTWRGVQGWKPELSRYHSAILLCGLA